MPMLLCLPEFDEFLHSEPLTDYVPLVALF